MRWFEVTLVGGGIVFLLPSAFFEAMVTVYFVGSAVYWFLFVLSRQRAAADDGAPLREVKHLLLVLSPAVVIIVINLLAGEQSWNKSSEPHWMKLLAIPGSLGLIGLFVGGPPWKWSREGWQRFAGATTVLEAAQLLGDQNTWNNSCWAGWLLPGISDTCR